MKTRLHLCGFTLIEMLVALIILSLLSTAGYRGLNAMIQTREHIAAETRHWQHLSQFFARMEEDIAQAVERPVRDREGRIKGAWIGRAMPTDFASPPGNEDAELTFTRSGTSGQGSSQLAPQRIAYRFENNSIVLLHWKSLDLAPNSEAKRYPVLEGVREFRLRYMDSVGNWYPQWPVASTGLPAATEVSVTLAGGEKITRVFALQ